MNVNITILGQIISFVLFVFFCMKYVWIPLISVIEKRQKEITDNLAFAKNLKTESESFKAEAMEYLKIARNQAQDIIKQANICRTQILNESKSNAYQERNRILLETQEKILQERKVVVEELRKKIGKIVVESVEKIIERSIDNVIDRELIDHIIERLSYEDLK